jgi:GABA(A) receptor-associated protein
MSVEFKNNNSMVSRICKSQDIMLKYPGCAPVFCEKSKSCYNITSLEKHKYLIPFRMKVGEFINFIRKTIKINSDHGIYLFINGNIPCITDNFFSLYHMYKDNDGFLYLTYTSENTFG